MCDMGGCRDHTGAAEFSKGMWSRANATGTPWPGGRPIHCKQCTARVREPAPVQIVACDHCHQRLPLPLFYRQMRLRHEKRHSSTAQRKPMHCRKCTEIMRQRRIALDEDADRRLALLNRLWGAPPACLQRPAVVTGAQVAAM